MNRWEDHFLEIYEFVSENEIDEFYASEIAEDVGLTSPGKIGRSMYNVLDEYDLPIDMSRDAPADPRLYTVEEFWPLSEVEDLLDDESFDPQTALINDAKNRLSDLETQNYTDTELNQFLREIAAEYFSSISARIENVGKAKSMLQEEGLIQGNSHDGYKITGN